MTSHDSVNHLQQLLAEGGETAFEAVPLTLRNVIADRLWAGRTDKEGNPFRSFEAFVTYRLWWGLESSIDDLLAFCRKHPDVQKLIRAEVDGLKGQGRPNKGYNVTFKQERGNKSTYALKRLKRDAPELFRRVVDGELSANAAAIEAGFRRRTITVPLDADKAAAALVRHFGPQEAANLQQAIERCLVTQRQEDRSK